MTSRRCSASSRDVAEGRGSDRARDREASTSCPDAAGDLFHLLLAPGSGTYVEQLAFAVDGPIHAPTLERAWNRIIGRHGALRTSFHWEDIQKPMQVVHRHASLTLTRLDWHTLAPAEHERELERHLLADRQRGFILSEAPLLRLTLAELPGGRSHVVVTFSHLILDGWSVQLVFGELDALYRSMLRGTEPELPIPPPFANYIAFLQEQDGRSAETFWRERMKGVTAPTPLPAPYLRDDDASPGDGVREQQFALSSEATRAIEDLARRCEVTVNTVVQGAWAIVLGCYANHGDVVYGSVVSGRPAALAGVNSMVGMFISTIPTRVHLPGDEPVAGWLRNLQSEQAEAQEHAYVPLTEIQAASEIPAGIAMFDSILAFENYPRATTGQRNTAHDGAVRTFSRTSYPLTLAVGIDGRLALALFHERERYDDRTACDLLRRLAAVLEDMAAKPDRPLSDIRLISGHEREELITASSGSAPDVPPEPLAMLFEAQAARTPSAVAVTDGGRSMTYAELDRAADTLASLLLDVVQSPSALIGVFAERSIAAVVAVLGIVKCGAAYVPLDPAYPEQRIRFMVDDADVDAIVTEESRRDEVPDGRETVFVDHACEGVRVAGRRAATTGVRDDALAYVMYTSGSTGEPKGTCVPHRAIKRLVLETDYVHLGPGDRVAMVSNFSFDAATFEIWGALLTGATLVCLPTEVMLDPVAFARQLRVDRVTTMFLTASLFVRIAADAPWAFGTVRDLLVGGERVDAGAVRAVLGSNAPQRLLNAYGPTETTTFAAWYPIERVPERAMTVPIGRPIANTQLFVLDRYRQPAPIGVIGELYIGGAGLARGYLNRPELTAERFVAHPFTPRPTPLPHRRPRPLRPDGNLEFLGRIDHQVKLRGYRIELGEIETVLRQHPAIADAAVTLREDRPGDRRLIAYLVPTTGHTATDMRGHAQQHLPDYMIPASFVTLDHLPLTPNGKVDHRALPAPHTTRPDLDHAYVAPRTDTERQLATIWTNVLGLDHIGIHDNFFALGGHSLLATQLVSRMREAFDLELPFDRLFDGPTVAEIAETIEALTWAASASAGAAATEAGWEEGVL